MKSKLLSIRIIFLTAGIAGSLFYFAQNTKAEDESITNLTEEQQDELEETQDKIKELEKKAQTYQEIIGIKQKQQMTLSNQVSIIETEAERLKAEIEFNKGKVEELNSQISGLEQQISEKEEIVSAQKKILTQLIRKYYEYNEEEIFSILFNGGGLISFTSGEDQVAQAGDKIREVLDNVESLKNKLEQEKKSAEEKKEDINNLYIEQKEKNSELQGNIDQKETLIFQTKGEENRYQDLLARVEAQKQELLGDIDELYSANTAEIDEVVKGLEKPSLGLASTSWYYSQKDSRWGNSRIGQSNSLIKDYGCALTSVAMIFSYYGEKTTPANLARQKIFYWDLIVWPDGKNINLVKDTKHGGVSWSEIDRELANGHPVIVFIKARSSAGHYVVIHHKVGSDYVVHDPYWGANIYLSSSIKLLSALYKTSVSKNSIDQMILYRK